MTACPSAFLSVASYQTTSGSSAVIRGSQQSPAKMDNRTETDVEINDV